MTLTEKELLHKIGTCVSFIADALVDEGDIVHLGSTNHKNVLEEMQELYYEWWLNNQDSDPNMKGYEGS